MPNQRKKTKVHIGGYYETDLKEQLRSIARAKKTTLSHLIGEFLRDGISAYQHGTKYLIHDN